MEMISKNVKCKWMILPLKGGGPGGFRAPVYVALSMNGSESENENGNSKISN